MKVVSAPLQWYLRTRELLLAWVLVTSLLAHLCGVCVAVPDVADPCASAGIVANKEVAVRSYVSYNHSHTAP